ncbi:MAG: type II toxin-antitoxin system prevent-host-death family antitoxin [Opitutaceae bacterium]|nr:type II toxin-antitoxin system prevent-host-death family antitoxin [Opitutaceae bacterium]
MTTLSVGEFKAQFSDILEEVRRGGVVGVRYGRAKKPVAVLVSAEHAPGRATRKLGLLEGKAKFRVKAGFKMTDAELLGS